MNTSPVDLQHGERYGKLTVLKKVKSKRGWRYRCGCVCGYSGLIVNATQLMRGRVTACRKCRNASLANSTETKETT